MMMPKSLLRHKDSTSEMADLTQRTFQPVIDDPAEPAPEGVRRIVFCTGKVFFDLKEGRETRKVDSVALVRIEQLNPFPFDEVGQVLQKYTAAEEIFWAQEEPQNMGAWDFTEPKIRKLLENKQSVVYAGRPATASTATGIQKVHLEQQKAVVDRALDF